MDVEVPKQQMMDTSAVNYQLPALEVGLKPLPMQMCMTEGSHCAPSSDTVKRDVTDVPTEELVPFCGTGCGIYSLFLGFPSCIGCAGGCGVLFLSCKYTCCKLLDMSDEDKKCCAAQACNCYLTMPNKCYEEQGQYFCLDGRQRCPPNNKTPCIINVAGITCCAGCKPKFGVCKKIGDLIPEIKEERAPES